jgi:hypothetical protein
MDMISVTEFAGRMRFRKRIDLADVQKLQRQILPDGILCRDHAEILIALDRDVARADASWSEFLVAALVDFVVWAERPTGVVKADTARWLANALAGNGASPTMTARLIAREVVEEAQAREIDALSALATAVPTGPDLVVPLAA